MKKTFWKSDWFAGLVISLLFLFAGGSAILQSLERKAYDMGVEASSRNPGDKIAIIAIDDQSIANIGRWPWSREVHAKMIDLLAGAHAKVIGNTVFFIEPQIDPGLSYINKLAEVVANTPEIGALPQSVELNSILKDAQDNLNADAKLATSIKAADSVVIAMPFVVGEPRGNPDKPLPDYVLKNGLSKIIDKVGAEESGLLPLPTINALPPVATIGESAAAIGHLNANPDVDGAIRSEPLVLAYYDQFYPSLSLQIAAKYLNLKDADIQVKLGQGVKLGKLNIATDGFLQMNTFFYANRDGHAAFPIDSFYDVISGKIPVEKYKDKIVLIGATAGGIGDSQVTPISSSMTPIETLAHSVASILNEDFFVAPSWGFWVEKAAWLLVSLYLILLLPRLKAGMAAGISAAIFVILVATHFYLMTQQALWLQLMIPATLLVVGHALLTTKRFLMTERGK
ncbi:MAG TPA: CHASE2 domain-containing protein [Methyloradius sp.]